tara:strand:+ start:2096 stop:3043 length:948 start_codon:yes stop_codon:yes gene_type:complete
MSVIYKGQIIESEQSKNANGGTEMMRRRLLNNVDHDLLSNVAIHFSRPRGELPSDVKNVLYCHDLAQDPENAILLDDGWKKFDHLVFVSQWQRDQYILIYGIPYSKCSVIPNAIEKTYNPKDKPTDTIRFIYHTTPHRGLELLYPVFDALSKDHNNIHLDVYSSFAIYGWAERDEPYVDLFTKIHEHPKMTYHGSVPNSQIMTALDDAHIFLYPNTWRETSCIAMIEAIRSGVLCIHPNLGALSETAANATVMYDYHEDNMSHANIAYSYAKQILDIQNNNPDFLNQMTNKQQMSLHSSSIEVYKNNWHKILRDL